MKDAVIVIVGCGATSISLLGSLARTLQMDRASKLTIYIVEKRRLRGRGLAYDADAISNLLNTRAGFITPFADRPGHFFQWLSANRAAWKNDFPDLTVEPESFVPRPLFGLYMEYVASDLTGELAQCGVYVIHVRAEVTDLEHNVDGSLTVITNTSLTIKADYVVLCCGNIESREYSDFERHPGFYASPYPVRKLTRTIGKGSSVAVLGARLSAIDAVLGLIAAGHKGPLTMFSRSGYFPSVRGSQGRYVPKLLTLERIQSYVGQHGRLKLSVLVNWAAEEIALAGGSADLTALPPAPPTDPLAFFESEIAAAAEPRPWQAVLYATNAFIDYAWQALDDNDRKKFLSLYQSAWMSYRVSIPVENARRLVEAARKGQLSFSSGHPLVLRKADGRFAIRLGEADGCEIKRYNAVVCVFGSPRDLEHLDSMLVRNLVAKAIGCANRYGGLDTDPDSGRIKGPKGHIVPNLYAIGELTSGTNFFTSALEINARHAQRCARHISISLTQGVADIMPAETATAAAGRPSQAA